MKTNKLVWVILLGLFAFSAKSQSRYFDERYIYTQSNIYPQLINPAAYGANEKHNVMLNYRRKWAGIDNTPSTITLGYDGQVADRLGLGVMVLRDNFGLLETTKAMAGASYTIKGENNQFGFGLSGEYI